jgi:predicted RNA binding protein YcfA (HicA-like mRNA interferase family)
MHKDYKQLVRAYRRKGWSVRRTKGSHLCWRGPAGQLIYSGTTPGDQRALAHLVARLKRDPRPGRESR